jgi:quinol monooxygenase YgiN
MIIVCGFVHLNSRDVDNFMNDAQVSLSLARSAPGCLLISFAIDDHKAGRIVVVERWKSQEDLDQHLTRPEVVAIFQKWSPRIKNKVRKFDASNERDPRE